MVKVVMFDLDGTLHNREESIQRFIENQHERLFPNLDKQDYAQRFIDLDQGGYVWKDKVYQQMVKEFAIVNVSWQALLEDYLTYYPAHAKLYPQVKELLTAVRKQGMKLAIISNGYSRFQRDVIHSLQIDKFFDEIIISEEVNVKKPDPYIFELTLSRLGVIANEAIYVGDHIKNDIEGARSVGIHPIWKQSYAKSAIVAGDYVCDLLEVLTVIKE